MINNKPETPIDFLIITAEMMNWRIAIPKVPSEEWEIPGVIIGTKEYLSETLTNPDDYDIIISPYEQAGVEEPV